MEGGSGVIHVPCLIKVFGKGNKASHDGQCRVDPKNLGIKHSKDILVEGIYFGLFISFGA